MPFGFHPVWLVFLLIIVLIIFGPGKLPELGAGLGRGIKEFRKHSDALKDEVTNAVKDHEEHASTTTTATATPAPEVKPAAIVEQPKPQAETKP